MAGELLTKNGVARSESGVAVSKGLSNCGVPCCKDPPCLVHECETDSSDPAAISLDCDCDNVTFAGYLPDPLPTTTPVSINFANSGSLPVGPIGYTTQVVPLAPHQLEGLTVSFSYDMNGSASVSASSSNAGEGHNFECVISIYGTTVLFRGLSSSSARSGNGTSNFESTSRVDGQVYVSLKSATSFVPPERSGIEAGYFLTLDNGGGIPTLAFERRDGICLLPTNTPVIIPVDSNGSISHSGTITFSNVRFASLPSSPGFHQVIYDVTVVSSGSHTEDGVSNQSQFTGCQLISTSLPDANAVLGNSGAWKARATPEDCVTGAIVVRHRETGSSQTNGTGTATLSSSGSVSIGYGSSPAATRSQSCLDNTCQRQRCVEYDGTKYDGPFVDGLNFPCPVEFGVYKSGSGQIQTECFHLDSAGAGNPLVGHILVSVSYESQGTDSSPLNCGGFHPTQQYFGFALVPVQLTDTQVTVDVDVTGPTPSGSLNPSNSCDSLTQTCTVPVTIHFDSCGSDPVSGCCLPDGSCINATSADCTSQGGTVLPTLCSNGSTDQRCVPSAFMASNSQSRPGDTMAEITKAMGFDV